MSVEDKLMNMAKCEVVHKIKKEFIETCRYSPIVYACDSFQESYDLGENIGLKMAINALVLANRNMEQDLQKYITKFGGLKEPAEFPTRDLLGIDDKFGSMENKI